MPERVKVALATVLTGLAWVLNWAVFNLPYSFTPGQFVGRFLTIALVWIILYVILSILGGSSRRE